MKEDEKGLCIKVDTRNEEIFICDKVYYQEQRRVFVQGANEPSFAFGSKRFIYSKELDTRELLKKYMKHVEDSEGTTFVCACGDSLFTDEEVADLKKIEDEIKEEY